MQSKSIWSFVWRGALGGIIGAVILLLFAALNYKLTLGYIPYSYLFIVGGLAVIAPIGVIVGAVIGVLVWLVEFKTERNLGVITRALAGAIVALIAGAAITMMSAGNQRISITTVIINLLVWVFTLGVLPGIMARAPVNNPEEPQ